MSNENKIIKKGEIIYREGTPAKSLYIIKKGLVRLLKMHDSRMIIVANLNDKDVFGSEDIFKKSTYSNFAVALEDTELVEIKAEDVRSLIGSMPSWIDHILGTLSHRLGQAENILVEHKIYESELNDEIHVDEALSRKIKKSLTNIK